MKKLGMETDRLGENVCILHLSGDLDHDTRKVLSVKFGSLFALGMKQITVDLADLEYIASAGAGVFHEALVRGRERGVTIVFVNLHPKVRYIFERMGLPTDTDDMETGETE